MKKVFMFPGQGSQKTGMGDNLFQEFSDIVDTCEDIFREERGGYSIREICTSPNKIKLLNQTDFTQPFLYLVNALNYQKAVSEGNDGDIFIGHSLGEYNALQAAGGFDLFTGFRLVMKRGKLMNQSHEGKMVAVLGLEDTEIEAIVSQYNSKEKPAEIANYNSPGQTIVSGAASVLESMEEVFKKAGAKKVVWLPVSGAFHSSLMKDAAREFEAYLQNFTFSPLKKPVYANVTALPYSTNSDDIPSCLTKQIYSPVRWTTEIQNLRHQYSKIEFTEIGPGQVLTGLVKRIL